MSVFEFLLEHGRLLTAFNIKPILLERELDYKDEMGDMLEAYEALSLVEKMAYKAGSGEVDFDIAYFLKIYPEYSEVAWGAYNEARSDKVSSDYIRSIEKAAEGRQGKATVYCPQGHNQTFVDAYSPWDECAGCGSIMTEIAEDEYCSVLVACGQAR